MTNYMFLALQVILAMYEGVSVWFPRSFLTENIKGWCTCIEPREESLPGPMEERMKTVL